LHKKLTLNTHRVHMSPGFFGATDGLQSLETTK
jgi:hypothetical protein